MPPSPTPGGSWFIKKTEENPRQRGSINEGEATKGSPAAVITVTRILAWNEEEGLFSLVFKASRVNMEAAGGLFLQCWKWPAVPPWAPRTPLRSPRGTLSPTSQACLPLTASRGASITKSSRANVLCIMKTPPLTLGLKACVRISGSESEEYLEKESIPRELPWEEHTHGRGGQSSHKQCLNFRTQASGHCRGGSVFPSSESLLRKI